MRKDSILKVLKELVKDGSSEGVTASEIAVKMGIQRHNASADLNELFRDGLVVKSNGRPVRFRAVKPHIRDIINLRENNTPKAEGLEEMIGFEGSLKKVIGQAKAAMVYPPNGLPTLILGPTGVGKSYLAEAMYKYSVRIGRIQADAPFNIFNCADYASNPQLLLSQLFGHVKGAFTGADKDSAGILSKTNGGILFLDEVHRLPPEGQEMLFVFMDKGIYRALGDSSVVRKSSLRLIAATSEDPKSALLKTFMRRFPVTITIPSLTNRPLLERLALIEYFLKEEASRIGISISVSPLALVGLLAFNTTGNIGELRSVIQIGCAKAFLNYIGVNEYYQFMPLYITDMSPQVQFAYFSRSEIIKQAEGLIGVDDKVYEPERNSKISNNLNEGYVPYSTLKGRIDGYVKSGLKQYEIEQLINTEIHYYLQRLIRLYKKSSINSASKEIQVAVENFISSTEKTLECMFFQGVINGLCMYLASEQVYNTYQEFDSLDLITHCTKVYSAVKQNIYILEKGIHRKLSSSELIFIAMFLHAHEKQNLHTSQINIVVLCHGNNTATSMVEVANSLIGHDQIIAIDMPLDQSVESAFSSTVEKVRQSGKSEGVLLLVDMGSLTNFKPLLEKAVNMPVEVVPLVTTIAVIEAARLANEKDINLERMAEKIKNIYKADDVSQVDTIGKNVVITTCLTGKGTARRLVSFLYEGLPQDLRDKIIIQPVDIENGSEVSGLMIDGWKGSIIAAVGTVDPHLPKVTFIGIEEILFGDGLKKLNLLLASSDEIYESSQEEVSRDEAIGLACRFITESAITGNREQASEAAVQALEQLEYYLGIRCSSGQAARFIIHFAFMLERISTDGLVSTCTDMEYLKKNHKELLENIQQVLKVAEEQWGIDIPEPEIGFLALILLTH